MFPGSSNKKIYQFVNNELNDLDEYEEKYLFNEYCNDSDFDTTDSEEENEKVVPDPDLEFNKEDNNDELVSNSQFYTYNIKENLEFDFENISDFNFPLHLCIYHINTEGINPFLSYLLVKNGFTNVLQFPNLFISSECNLVKEIDIYIQKLSITQHYIQGYKIEENEMYIFIEIKNNNQMIFDYNYFYFALIDEIINSKQIFDLKIDESKITNFFIQNPEFIYLLDNCNKPLEIPIVAYQGIEEKKLEFTFMFGHTKSDFTELMGPYFYFTSYKNVLKKFNDKKIKYGIIRYGLFLGSMKIPMNFLEDEIDTSATKSVFLNKEETKTNAILSLRISDHDGNWSQIYDSVYLGRTELDNGEFLEDTPKWVIKNYSQQFSLSYKIIYPKIKII
jgi:hypothetical protein